MKAFAELYRTLDETTRTNRKIAALRDYFAAVHPADGAWAVYFLSGRRLKRHILSRNLRVWCAELVQLPDWLFAESYDAVGDLAETIALLLPPPETVSDATLTEWVEDRLRPLRGMSESEQRTALHAAWRELDATQRFLFNKLLTGSFRVGVSQKLVVRALAELSGIEATAIAHRLMGDWQATPVFYQSLLSQTTSDVDISRPFPFCLAHPLETDPAGLGAMHDWLLEWKWDGIRAQLVRRDDQTFLWSRGEELITERFPEIRDGSQKLANGVVLDGEILGWNDSGVLPFGALQRRIGRKKVGAKLLKDVPVVFVAFDQLESHAQDLRSRPLAVRRSVLQETLERFDESDAIRLSPQVDVRSWDAAADLRSESRARRVEGLMLKHRDSEYGVGRVTGLWWKWKIEPYTCDAVMIYAQRGHGRRANLYSDYTFAAWDNGELVPFAKAYSGLTDAEMREVDRFVRRNTVEKFGPVRSVKPELVFELAFENIQTSKRHKSGIAVRFPRMVRWRRDKRPRDADSLQTIRRLLAPSEPDTTFGDS